MKRIITFLVEAATVGAAVFLASGIDSSILCGIAGVVLLVIFGMELNVWEGGI